MNFLQINQTIRNTYEVERFLGEGAFAEVYRVRHRFLGRQALKIFKTSGMASNEIQIALGEALILSRLEHPNIIRVFDANTLMLPGGEYGYFTMEYIAGGTLEKYWQSYGIRFMPTEIAVDLVRQACRGITVAHGEKPPIVHRDIKPQNILVGYDETGLRVKVSDFGLAKHVNPLSLYASARGTLCFKAPEVFRDPGKDSCAGDVWALGCTLYLLLTDRLPYETAGQDLDIDPYAAFREPWVDPSELNFAVDDELNAILRKSLALSPDARYTNAGELLNDLEKWSPKERTILCKSQPGMDSQKIVLGVPSPVDEKQADQLVREALGLSVQPAHLSQAADLLEEALMKSPHLREKYEYRLQLWRRGITG